MLTLFLYLGHWVFLVASLLVIAVGVAFLVKRIKSRLALDNDHLNSDFEKSSNSSLPSSASIILKIPLMSLRLYIIF